MGLGIDYNDTPSPYYSTDKNQYGEGNLLPLVSVRGIDPFDETNGLFAKDKGLTAIQGGTNRFIINISPLKNETYPHDGWDKTLINLDTIQLYAPNPKIDYKFGKDYEAATPDLDYPPYFSDTTGGVYDSPVPIRGAPVEFRKVYFRGQLVDKDGGYVTGSGCDERSFQAVFACSKPIEQTIHASDSEYSPIESGLLLNPRNENFAQSEYAIEREWEEIEILSCGSGGSGCSDAFSVFSGQITGSAELTGYSGSGCDNFIFSGYSGIATNLTGNALEIYYTGCSDVFSVFSGQIDGSAELTGYSSSGCDNFIFSGYSGIATNLTGNTLEVYYTGCLESFTGFHADEGSYAVSGCDQFIFSGCSGIKTVIRDVSDGPNNILEICYTGEATGGCTGFTSVTVGSTTYTPDACGSGITFEGTGCLGLESEAIVDGIKIKYGINDEQILECLGFEEKEIQICEDGSAATYTFLVKSS